MARLRFSHVAVVVILGIAGVGMFGFIPGAGILLLFGALLVGAVGLSTGRHAPVESAGLRVSSTIALVGIVVIFVQPLIGTFLLLAGIGLAIGFSLRDGLERARRH